MAKKTYSERALATYARTMVSSKVSAYL